MGAGSNIAWTDATWNPWVGCHKVGPGQGCRHCYAEAWAKRTGRDFRTVTRSAPATFNLPLSKKLKPGNKVFSCSLSDFFHADADAWRNEAWDIIRRRPDLTFQILTKRPERIMNYLPWLKRHPELEVGIAKHSFVGSLGEPWPNVWLGTSTEDQRCADERIPKLLSVPAAVHFLSVEPLLGPVNLEQYFRRFIRPSWLIVGGESGPGHTECRIEWIEDIVRQCIRAGVPVFVKQDSGQYPGRQGRIPDEFWLKQFPAVRP